MTTITIILFGMFLIYIGAKPQNKNRIKLVPAPTDAKIATDLVPKAMHGLNVRSRVDGKTWQLIAHTAHNLNRIAYRLQPAQCEVCRSNGFKQGFGHALEAHEEWSFNHGTRSQKLMRIRSLCPMCHKAVHFGLAERDGYGERVKAHMQKVNGWTADQVEAHIYQARQTVKAMTDMGLYKLDLSYLNSDDYRTAHKFRFTNNETHNCRPNIHY